MKYNPAVVSVFFESYGLPAPTFEHQNIPGRRFRLDIAWPDHRVGIEVQGGIHPFPRKMKDGRTILMPGAHGTAIGIKRDMEKNNLNLLHGWRVLEVEPKNLCLSETADMARALLDRGRQEPGGGEEE